MAFTHDPNTDEGLLRTLLRDVDSTNYTFEDDELTAVLDLNSSDIWRAAADLCRSKAAELTESAFSLGLGKGDISLDRKKRPEYWITLSRIFDSRSGSDVVEYVDSGNYNMGNDGVDRSEYIGDD